MSSSYAEDVRKLSEEVEKNKQLEAMVKLNFMGRIGL
jgi:hypothetical protein